MVKSVRFRETTQWKLGFRKRIIGFCFWKWTVFRYLSVCDDKKAYLILNELVLSWAVIEWFLFVPLKFSRNPVVSFLPDESDAGLKGCSDSSNLWFGLSELVWIFKYFHLHLQNLYSDVLNLIDLNSNISLQSAWHYLLYHSLVLEDVNRLSANPLKWSNTLKQFVGNLPYECLTIMCDWRLKG